MSERSSIVPRKVRLNGARSMDWGERNWLMHAGASGVVYAQRVMNGEVGVAILHRLVPERSAVVSAECRTRIRERHVPFHSVRESSATLRLVSWMYGAEVMFRVEYHVCTISPHNVTRTGPVLSVRRTSQTVLKSLVP